MTGVYAAKPWLALYGEGQPASITPEHDTLLAVFEATLAATPDAVAIRYFDGTLTFADLDTASDALALGLLEGGFAAGDRMGLYVQNDPAFVVGLLGAWKAGGSAVAINPMNKAAELTYLLTDSGATALLCLDELYESVARGVLADTVGHHRRHLLRAGPPDPGGPAVVRGHGEDHPRGDERTWPAWWSGSPASSRRRCTCPAPTSAC